MIEDLGNESFHEPSVWQKCNQEYAVIPIDFQLRVI